VRSLSSNALGAVGGANSPGIFVVDPTIVLPSGLCVNSQSGYSYKCVAGTLVGSCFC
jgi:hypothetical protein